MHEPDDTERDDYSAMSDAEPREQSLEVEHEQRRINSHVEDARGQR